MEPKVKALGEVQIKLDAAGLTLNSLDQQIKEAESSLAPLEETKNALNEGIETLETKLTEKSELLEHAGELGKLGFDTERLRQLKDALTEIGAKNGLNGKEAVSKFFDDLKDYEAVLEAEALLQGRQTQVETKKLAEYWRAGLVGELDHASDELKAKFAEFFDLYVTVNPMESSKGYGFSITANIPLEMDGNAVNAYDMVFSPPRGGLRG